MDIFICCSLDIEMEVSLSARTGGGLALWSATRDPLLTDDVLDAWNSPGFSLYMTAVNLSQAAVK